MNLTDLELQAWAMMVWLERRLLPTQPSRSSGSISRLMELGLVEERPVGDDNNPRGEWEIRLTKKGSTFNLLPVLTRIRTHIRCSAWWEAADLIKTELSIEQLPEFISHANPHIRKAAKVAIGCKPQESKGKYLSLGGKSSASSHIIK